MVGIIFIYLMVSSALPVLLQFFFGFFFISGDSVSSPLLAVFSGLMYKDDYGIRRIPEVVAQSGSALLHFYSDIAYNMTGFNITYK